jgi:hypothetical protein
MVIVICEALTSIIHATLSLGPQPNQPIGGYVSGRHHGGVLGLQLSSVGELSTTGYLCSPVTKSEMEDGLCIHVLRDKLRGPYANKRIMPVVTKDGSGAEDCNRRCCHM